MGFLSSVKDFASDATGGFFGLESVYDSLGGSDMFGGTDARAIQKPAFDISGGLLGGGGFDPRTGQITLRPSGLASGLQQQMFGQAGRFGRLIDTRGLPAERAMNRAYGALGSFDPFEAAEEQFSRLDAILEPGRSQARSGTAAGLLASGRLGSTAGARTQAELEGEIERQRQGLLAEQFGRATDVQAQLANMATGFGQAADLRRESAMGLSQQALGGALGIDAQLQALLGLGSQVSSPAGIQEAQEGLGSQFLGGLASGGAAALVGLI